MNRQMHIGEPTEESRLAFEGRLFDVRVDTVRLASGRRTTREIVIAPNSVSVVPVDEDGNVYLVRQYRKPPERLLLEVVAGGVDEGESAEEAARLCQEAKRRGVERIIVPAVNYAADLIGDIVATGAYAEFFFFGLTHATHTASVNVEAQINSPSAVSLADTAARIRAAGPERTILSGDLGMAVLPPPVEGLREFLLTIRSAGFSDDEIRAMVVHNPTHLFKVG